MSRFASPLRYPGGKNCIFKFVADMFCNNDMVGISYAEPYAGGSGLALRLLFEEYADRIYINDFDRSIYAFWKTILDYSDNFCDWIEDVPVNIESWNHYKSLQQDSKNKSLMALSKSTFFLNRTNISGVIKGGVIGGASQKGRYKIDARFNKADLIKRIQKIARFKDRIEVSNLDGINFIKNINKRKENMFVYLDPPYFEKGSSLYMNYYVQKDHEHLARYVKKINKKWMVSYDNNNFIISLYNDFQKVSYELSHATSNKIGNEIFVFPNHLKFSKSTKYLHNSRVM